jgi:hypothetical protein
MHLIRRSREEPDCSARPRAPRHCLMQVASLSTAATTPHKFTLSSFTDTRAVGVKHVERLLRFNERVLFALRRHLHCTHLKTKFLQRTHTQRLPRRPPPALHTLNETRFSPVVLPKCSETAKSCSRAVRRSLLCENRIGKGLRYTCLATRTRNSSKSISPEPSSSTSANISLTFSLDTLTPSELKSSVGGFGSE